ANARCGDGGCRGDDAIPIDHPVIANGVCAVATRQRECVHRSGEANVARAPALTAVCGVRQLVISERPTHVVIGELNRRLALTRGAWQACPARASVSCPEQLPGRGADVARLFVVEKDVTLTALGVRNGEGHGPRLTGVGRLEDVESV